MVYRFTRNRASGNFINGEVSELVMSYHWLWILGGLIYQIILIVVVASDAKSRGHSWLKWGILTLLFGIFAAIIYLVIRNDERMETLGDKNDEIEERKVESEGGYNDTQKDYDIDEEGWESLPRQFGIEYQEISENGDERILVAKRENKVGKFIITETGVEADSETEENNSEKWIKRTSKLLDIHFN